jgi:hypothetical protein
MRPVIIVALLVATAPVRVYIAPLSAPNVDAATVALVSDRVLTATQRHQATFDVVSSKEVQSVMDAEAAKQALGCDAESCAAEIADALAAPQLVTGQLGRIGETWQLTLTRTERATLRSLARVHVEAEGDTAEDLLPKIPSLVDELFGVAPPVRAASPLPWVGGVGIAVGALGVVGGGAMVALAWQQYFVAKDALALAEPKVKDAEEARDLGQTLAVAGWGTVAAGAVIAAVGGGLVLVGILGDDE